MKNFWLGWLALLAVPALAAENLLGARWLLYAEQQNASLTQTGGVMRLEVRRPSEPFYLTQVLQPLTQVLPAGHKVELSFQARAPSNNAMRVVLEQNGEPYTAVIESNPVLGGEWKRCRASDVTEREWPAGSLGVKFQAGQQAGVIELRDIRLEDQGEDPRLVAAKAALAPEKIEARIREHRMAEVRLEVRDAAGRPVPNASVRIEQQSHAFLFGCNIFELRPDDAAPLQKAYQDKFTALLNYATLPFYWGTFEPQRGQPHNARLEQMARWCRQRGLACKGHPLVWHEVWPGWAPADMETALPLLRARVNDLIPRYRETIRYWDVVNEANSSAHTRTGVGQWIKRDGPAAAVATALGWAREADRGSGATLLYNDFKVNAENVDLLHGLRERNALPDAIGLQSHMHAGPWPLPRVWDVAEQFAVFGRPLHFTELTVVSGPEPRHVPGAKHVAGWATTSAGEAAQAQYVAELYKVLFSHPALRAITWWDFSDYHAWKGAPAGLLRKDMTPKPVYDELFKLIRSTWWTRASVTTDAKGVAAVRVFRGAHRIAVTGGDGRTAGQTLVIGADGAAPPVRLTLP